MIDMTDVKQIKALQNSLRHVFGSDSGKEVIRMLEQICGWYDFNETNPDRILIAHGRRQVLATIKTLLDKTPDDVRALAIRS